MPARVTTVKDCPGTSRECSGDDSAVAGGKCRRDGNVEQEEVYYPGYIPIPHLGQLLDENSTERLPHSGYTTVPQHVTLLYMPSSSAAHCRVSTSWALLLRPAWVEGPGSPRSHLSCLDPSVRCASASRLSYTNGTKDRMCLGQPGFWQLRDLTDVPGVTHPTDHLMFPD